MRRASKRHPENARPLAGVIDLRVLAAAVVIASSLLLITLTLLLVTRPPRPEANLSTAVMTMIAANTSTPVPENLASGTPESAQTALPTPQPGVISLGAYVQIVGTGGDGLRLRDQPGLEGKVLILGSESEVFRIEEGPKDLDGYTWWYLVGPFDDARRGWAVTNYLQLVQAP